MTQASDRVLDKIKKLLAMANDERGNDQERETAMRQAYSLLAKHSLDLESYDALQKEQFDPRVRHEVEGWSMGWSRQVHHTIGKLFMCSYLYGRKINATKQMHLFFGRTSNVMTASYMATYVVNSILKEGCKLYGSNLCPETRQFATGAWMALERRVDEMIKEGVIDQESGERALVPVSLREQETRDNEAMWENMQIKSGRSVKVNTSTSAARNGAAYGSKINLNAQVAGNSHNLRLK